MENSDRDSYSLKEFAKRNSISISYLYQLLKDGKGPKTIRVGDRRRLITAKAAAEWRQQLESRAA
ncbi:excisionase [Beijerinckiaceae bacterium]|nr:excisionase [Beijerinckiaceae bacterium]